MAPLALKLLQVALLAGVVLWPDGNASASQCVVMGGPELVRSAETIVRWRTCFGVLALTCVLACLARPSSEVLVGEWRIEGMAEPTSVVLGIDGAATVAGMVGRWKFDGGVLHLEEDGRDISELLGPRVLKHWSENRLVWSAVRRKTSETWVRRVDLDRPGP